MVERVVIEADINWLGDWWFKLNGKSMKYKGEWWRAERIIRRLSRDRLLAPHQSRELISKLEKKFPRVRRSRSMPPTLNGMSVRWVYRGQTLTERQMDLATAFVKNRAFTTRRGYELYLWPVGKRHSAIKAYNRRCTALKELKLDAADLQRRVHYERYNPYDASKHIRFEESTSYYAQEIRRERNINRRSVSGSEDYRECSEIA